MWSWIFDPFFVTIPPALIELNIRPYFFHADHGTFYKIYLPLRDCIHPLGLKLGTFFCFFAAAKPDDGTFYKNLSFSPFCGAVTPNSTGLPFPSSPQHPPPWREKTYRIPSDYTHLTVIVSMDIFLGSPPTPLHY